MDSLSYPCRPRKSKQHIKASPDRPPQLSSVDKIIDHHHGTTTAIEMTPQRLQASKQCSIPSSRERIEQLQKQNSRMNHEVAYYRELEQHRVEFQDDMKKVKKDLERALFKLGNIQQKVGYGWAQFRQ